MRESEVYLTMVSHLWPGGLINNTPASTEMKSAARAIVVQERGRMALTDDMIQALRDAVIADQMVMIQSDILNDLLSPWENHHEPCQCDPPGSGEEYCTGECTQADDAFLIRISDGVDAANTTLDVVPGTHEDKEGVLDEKLLSEVLSNMSVENEEAASACCVDGKCVCMSFEEMESKGKSSPILDILK